MLSEAKLPPLPRDPCPVCGLVLNPECPACVATQVKAELAALAETQED